MYHHHSPGPPSRPCNRGYDGYGWFGAALRVVGRLGALPCVHRSTPNRESRDRTPVIFNTNLVEGLKNGQLETILKPIENAG